MAADIATTSNMECAIKKKGKEELQITVCERKEDQPQKCHTIAGFCAIVVTFCMITSALFINTKMLASSNEGALAGAGIGVLFMTLVADSAYASNRDTWHCALDVVMV